MFDWLGDLLEWIGDLLSSMGAEVAGGICNSIAKWIYEMIYGSAAVLFKMMGNMGVQVVDLPFCKTLIKLFSMFGWAMFVVGVVVAVGDLGIEAGSREVNLKGFFLNLLKGFFAAQLFATVPIALYRWTVTIGGGILHDLVGVGADSIGQAVADTWSQIPEATEEVRESLGLAGGFGELLNPNHIIIAMLVEIVFMIVFIYCIGKLFLDNLKRGGILLIQIAVGSLYMVSIPRGYTDGFTGWCKQVIALCLTQFLQVLLMFLGVLIFTDHMVLATGILLAAKEVPRIAAQFGLDTSTRVNLQSAAYTAQTAIRLTQIVAGAK